MKQIIFLITILLLCVGFVSAVGEYPSYGFNQGIQENGLFNEAIDLDRITESARSLTSPVLPPLVADLDGDGINEIVVLDGVDIKIYQNQTLGQITNTFSQNASAPFGHMVLFNIDADPFIEIILSSRQSRQLDILEFNGTALGRQKSFDLASITVPQALGNDAEHVIGCDSVTKRCALAFVTTNSAGGSTSQYGVVGFNSTNMGTALSMGVVPTFGGGGVGFAWCMPRIRTMTVTDVDADGTNEYIFNIIRVRGELVGTGTHNEAVYINSISIGSTLNIINEMNSTQDLGDIIATATTSCSSVGALNYVSPVLVMDADVGIAGQEIIYGAQTGTTDITTGSGQYNLFMVRATGVFEDEFPEAILSNTAGVILSNPFRANALANDGRTDFCILGMAPLGSTGSGGESEINVLCGSHSHTANCISGQCEHAEFDGQQSYNISSASAYAIGSWNIMAHASQMEGTTTSVGGANLNGDDLDEVITSYGVIRLDYNSGNDFTTTTTFANTKGDAVVYALDIEKNNPALADLLYMTATNLWYINDGFDNQGAFITSQTYEPCITNQVIQQNTTVDVFIVARDEERVTGIESDLVSCNITAYPDTANEQSSPWSPNASSGATHSFFFVANVTGTSTLIMRCRDSGNPSDIDVRTQSFSVASVGAVAGSGSCTTLTALPDTSGSNATGNLSQQPSTDNILTQGIAGLNSLTGLGTTAIWLILMILLAVGIWMIGHENRLDHYVAFGLIVFVEVLMFVLGAIFGFISVGIVITLVVISITILALLFGRKLLFGGS